MSIPERDEDWGPIVGSGEMNGCVWQVRAHTEGDVLFQNLTVQHEESGSGSGGGSVGEFVSMAEPLAGIGHGWGRSRSLKTGRWFTVHHVDGLVSSGVAKVSVEAGRRVFDAAIVDFADPRARYFVAAFPGRKSPKVANAFDDAGVLLQRARLARRRTFKRTMRRLRWRLARSRRFKPTQRLER